MNAQTQHTSELIPRPDMNPEALRRALAIVSPDELEEMHTSLVEAAATARREESLSYLKLWELRWARDIEIARVPELRDRYHTALSALHDPKASEEQSRAAADDLSSVLDEAMKAVRA